LNFWDIIAIQPLSNVLVALAHFLFNNFGLAIIALTIIIRGAMYPLTMKQLRASKKMQDLQPKLAEVQKKFAKDKEKLAQEQMRLYKESGVSPLGCLLPMLIQLPVWVALYQSIIRVLGGFPENMLDLSQYLYNWQINFATLPINNQFLWFDLAQPDPYYILPVIVGGTMWVQQKMTMTVSAQADPQQKAQGQIMLWMMPIMFAVLTISFPSGLALYWVVSNIISIVMQYFVTGWGGLVKQKSVQITRREGTPIEKGPDAKSTALDEWIPTAGAKGRENAITTQGEGVSDEKSGSQGPERGGGDAARLKPARRQPRRGKGHGPKRR
jgi:YidC/Oxa1 family membrane protein insertase